MGWEVFVLLHALFSALSALQARGIARLKHAREAAFFVNTVTFVTLFLAGLVLLPFIGGVDWQLAKSHIGLLIASAVFFNFGLFYLYRALVYLESATATVLATSSALFSLMFGRLIFGEHLSAMQVAGTAVLVPCIVYVMLLAKRRQKFVDFKDLPWMKGALYVLISSFCMAFGHVLEKELVVEGTIGNYVAFGFFFQAVFALALFVLFGRKNRRVVRDRFIVKSAVSIGILRVGAALFFLYALQASNSLSLVMVVANFRIVIVAVLAGWLLGERRFYYRKLIVAAISLIGLSIIFWA